MCLFKKEYKESRAVRRTEAGKIRSVGGATCEPDWRCSEESGRRSLPDFLNFRYIFGQRTWHNEYWATFLPNLFVHKEKQKRER